jgi:hypothetical protein
MCVPKTLKTLFFKHDLATVGFPSWVPTFPESKLFFEFLREMAGG